MPLVLLDRDGVLNVDWGRAVLDPDELVLIPGAAKAVRELNDAGIKVAICTNQACVGRGELSDEALHSIHAKLYNDLFEAAGARIDGLYVATDAGESPRKKPAPGMLLEALRDFNADALATPFIGDAVRDILAAEAAGCEPILVKTGKGLETLDLLKINDHKTPRTYPDLLAFVRDYLRDVVAA